MPITNPFTSRKAAFALDKTQSDPKTTDTMEVDTTTNRLKTPTKMAPAPGLKDLLKTPSSWRNSGRQTVTAENTLGRMATPSEGHLTGAAGQALKAEKKFEGVVASIVLGLFDARTAAHLLHLQTKSYAKHWMACTRLFRVSQISSLKPTKASTA